MNIVLLVLVWNKVLANQAMWRHTLIDQSSDLLKITDPVLSVLTCSRPEERTEL